MNDFARHCDFINEGVSGYPSLLINDQAMGQVITSVNARLTEMIAIMEDGNLRRPPLLINYF
jgi:hypothetical protein